MIAKGTAVIRHIRHNDGKRERKATNWVDYCPMCYFDREPIPARALRDAVEGKYALAKDNFILNDVGR